MLDPDGKLVPARAKITLVRGEKTLEPVRTDDQGAFQIPALEPGPCSVLAVGDGGFASAAVQILPCDGSSIPGGDLLTLTLIPSDDDLSCDAPVGPLTPTNVPPYPAPMYGGGGGVVAGGGGGLPLAGLAGMAGLAGLAGGGGHHGGGGGPASPHMPY